MSGIRDALRQKASEIKSKGKQDVRRARRAANVDLDKLKRKAQQDVKTGRRAASSAASNAKSGLKQDLKKAERAASKKKGNLKRKAKQDVRAADRALMGVSAGGVAKKAAQAVGDGVAASAGGGTTPAGGDADTRAMADRARAAGEARAPIDADIDPMGNPREMEALATAGYGAPDEAMESFVVGGGMMQADADEMDSIAFFSGEDDGAAIGFFGDDVMDDKSDNNDDDRDAFGFGLGGGDSDVWF